MSAPARKRAHAVRALGEPQPRAQSAEQQQGVFERVLLGTQLLSKYPQFATVVARIDPVISRSVPSMAVALRRSGDPASGVVLLMYPDYLEAARPYVCGVLLHEIQHISHGHLSDEKFHRVAYPRLMEIAMEIAANQGISEPLPDGVFRWEDFACYGVTAEQSTLQRYAVLRAAHLAGDLPMAALWTSRMLDLHRPAQGGSCNAGLGDLLDSRSDRATARNWHGDSYLLSSPTPEDQKAAMRMQIQQHLRGPRGGADDPLNAVGARMAKELQRVVFEVNGVRKIDWRRVLRAAFPSKREVFADYMRPNRRFPLRIGEIPGRRRRPPKPNLLVAIDTSGSMTGAVLDSIAAQLRELRQFATIQIAECDSAVHRVYPLTGHVAGFVGGGDTDFAPVFEEAARDSRVTGVVYFTDGKGRMPRTPPLLPTLWAITHGEAFLAEFGSVLRMP